MKKAGKEYKKKIDANINIHRKEMSRKIENLRSNNSKEYWNILRQGTNKKQPNISIDSLFEFFRNINKAPETNNEDEINLPDIDNNLINNLNKEINGEITSEEIVSCVKNFKNDKASGDDFIINEYIKSYIDVILPVYHIKMFNCIFSSGIVPDIWLLGNIKPIYKNKGDPLNPKYVRSITILSCFGKLFTSILLKRLNHYSEQFSVLNESQCGFRKGYSTVDNIFVLHSFFELIKLKKKKLFATFVDFEKAFDTVWRDALWSKLLINNINGKMYNVIYNMYQNIKSRIVYNGKVSNYFDCNNGVRQGKKFSPFSSRYILMI